MSTKTVQTTPSQLERFKLGFEFNKTLREVKHEVILRTSVPTPHKK